jgi:GNAT superfamily N-acetyltransferase
MSPDTIPTTASAVAVHRATPVHDAEVRALFDQQRAWLESLGVPVADVQCGAGVEYADPLGYYRPPTGGLLIARADGRPVGVVAVKRRAPGRAELKRLFVLPEARGLGAGAALVDAAIALAATMPVRWLDLETIPGSMEAALALYRRAGFVDRPNFELTLPGVIALALDLAGRQEVAAG